METWLDRPEALAICGVRRCGKSTLMRQLAGGLVERGVAPGNILFVNFEEPVFLEYERGPGLLDKVFATYFEMVQPGPIPYLFFDEVHNVAEWARWVRACLDTRRARVVVSGSSSRLLEPDVATVLTGRNVTKTLWPLSFAEFLRFHGIEPAGELEARADAARLRALLVQYLRDGGMPEVVLARDHGVKETLLKQYFRDILFRDVVARHEVRDVRALEAVAHHYLVSTASRTTFNRVKNTLGLAMDQVRAYTSHLEEAYLVQTVPRFSYKVTEQARAPRKVYAVDVGLRNAVAFRFSEDLGRLAETVVHHHLVHDEDARTFHFSGRGECDFLVWKGDRAVEAIQVCFSPDRRIPPRELLGLVEAMRATGLSEGTVVTDDLESTTREGDLLIHACPLWLWLWRRSRTASA